MAVQVIRVELVMAMALVLVFAIADSMECNIYGGCCRYNTTFLTSIEKELCMQLLRFVDQDLYSTAPFDMSCAT